MSELLPQITCEPPVPEHLSQELVNVIVYSVWFWCQFNWICCR